jgi:hypothetical protein
MSGKIMVNGKEYDSVDDMPAEVRSVYQSMSGMLADADHNGVPDILEGKGNPAAVVTAHLNFHIVHDGKVYTNVSELPPDLQEKYEKAIEKLHGANSTGTPSVAGAGHASVSIITVGGPPQIIHDGNVFSNPADLPPEIRAKYEAAMKLLAAAEPKVIPAQGAGVSSAQAAASQSLPSGTSPAPSAEKPGEDSSKMLTRAAILMVVLAIAVVLLGLLILFSQNR